MTRDDKADIRYDLRRIASINFGADFHTLSSMQVEALVQAARQAKYRKPANANGSTARYFFAYLNRGAQ